MSVAAPLAAILVDRSGLVRPPGSRWLWAATVAQLLLLWAFHAPAAHRAMMDSAWLRSGLLAALFLSAVAFWLCLVSRRAGPPWQEILALLVTGKLACLLAALLVFAPRPLYAVGHHAYLDLADQQLAGLLMLAACPLSYILSGVVLAAQMLTELSWSAETALRPRTFGRQTA
jgi:putative membrane protein